MRHFQQNVTPLLAALHSGEYVNARGAAGADASRPHAPFVTISRQAGAGGRSLAARLVERLNELDPGELPWTVWDNELVERVASENHIPASRVAAMEDERPSWLEEALAGLSIGGGSTPDEATIFRRIAMTIRALAELGRVVVVGRGGAFITRGMPGGVHVRLVAPSDYRAAATAASTGASAKDAADWIREKDRAREAFYHRHWPGRPLIPEQFAMTLNSALLSVPQQVEAVLAVLPVRDRTTPARVGNESTSLRANH